MASEQKAEHRVLRDIPGLPGWLPQKMTYIEYTKRSNNVIIEFPFFKYFISQAY